MPEPCRSCERLALDFGGCRCQAVALTGDAVATDPACQLAPAHQLVRDGWRMIGHHSGPVPPIETGQTAAATASTAVPRDRRTLH